MAFRYEKNQLSGQPEIVIDGFEKGIADSPYKGIANIRNLNVKYYDGVAYANYKRLAATISGGTLGIPTSFTQSPVGLIYVSDTSGNIFKQSAVNSSTFNLLSGGPSGAGSGGIQFWNNYLIAFYSAGGGSGEAVSICGDGSGDAGIISTNWDTSGSANGVWPIEATTVALTGGVSAGDTSGTISTYTDAQGTSRAFWNGPTGSYNGNIAIGGQQVTFFLTQGSAAVRWFPAATNGAAGSLAISPVLSGSNNGNHYSLVSRNDGNIYFANANMVGSLAVNSGYTFRKTDFRSFSFASGALLLPSTEQVRWLEELRNLLLVGGNYNIYPWDRFSTSWLNPVPMQEGLVKMINILNNIYVFAGNKGNIYISNGYSIDRFKKVPDYLTGDLIDPVWTWGGIMAHRQKLYFQATATNAQTSTVVFSGIFSLDLDTGALVVENQNSYGTGSSVTGTPGLLIDNSTPTGYTTLYDTYYSAWVNNSAGGLDYNATTLYSNGEMIIETDLIPVGTFALPQTFSNMEFKLDQPMKSGDSIAVYARQSLSDIYTAVGSTTTAVLSDFYSPLNFQNFQWLQLKIVLTCNATATSSSFNRIREIRIRN